MRSTSHRTASAGERANPGGVSHPGRDNAAAGDSRGTVVAHRAPAATGFASGRAPPTSPGARSRPRHRRRARRRPPSGHRRRASRGPSRRRPPPSRPPPFPGASQTSPELPAVPLRSFAEPRPAVRALSPASRTPSGRPASISHAPKTHHGRSPVGAPGSFADPLPALGPALGSSAEPPRPSGGRCAASQDPHGGRAPGLSRHRPPAGDRPDPPFGARRGATRDAGDLFEDPARRRPPLGEDLPEGGRGRSASWGGRAVAVREALRLGGDG